MRNILLIFFFIYFLNQFSFVFYNYSWFSLLCSTYVIDFYNFFHFLFIYLEDIQQFCFIFLADNEMIMLDRWVFSFFFENFLFDFSKINTFIFEKSNKNLDSIYCLYFDTKVIGSSNVYFYVLQNKLFILPGETTLSFFRIYNENLFPISGITIYSITPFEFQSFLNKIQCFCFEEVVIGNLEVVELPVLFYLDTNITYLNTIQLKELCIEYILLCSKVA